MLKWLNELLTDERGKISSKRFVGILSALCLCVALFVMKEPSPTLVNLVAGLSFGSLGLSTADKIWNKQDK